MVRRSVIAFLGIATTFLLSCSKEENLSPATPSSSKHSFTLSAGAAGDDTRSTFDLDGHFYWLPADAVGVANASGSFSKLTLKDGSYTTSGTFSGEIEGLAGIYAVYPYNENHRIDGNTLTYHLPDTYTYKDLDHDYFTAGTESYNNSANSPAYGVISVDDEGNARTTFKHLCGVLCIRVTGLKSKSGYITLTADRKITGDFTADLSGSEPKISTSSKSETSSTERTVTINYESTEYDGTSGVDGVFYIPMPVGDYYLTLEVGYNDGFGKTMRMTKERTNTIACKSMMRMKVDYATMAKGSSYCMVRGHKFVNLGLPSGTFWAETNVGAETSTDYGGYYLWEDAVALTTWKKTWGNKCRLPSAAEAMELKENCTLEPYNITYDWDLRSYKGSLKVTGKNGNSIILPAAWYKDSAGNLKEPYMDPSLEGLYWTSDSNTYLLIYITTNTGTKLDSFMTQTDNAGYYCTIRPVITPAK